MSNPTLGNQAFTSVRNIASSEIQRLKADQVTASSVTASSVTAKTLTATADYNLAGLTTVTGYAPAAFSTLNGAVLSLVDSNGDYLTLPEGALVKDVSVTNGGVTITGSSPTNELATSNRVNLASNSGTVITLTSALSAADINANYFTPSAATTGADGTNIYVNVTNDSSANTAGSYVAYITYFLPPL